MTHPSSKPAVSADLDNRPAILEEINALLESPGAIDEMRAKKVRKALDAIRGPGSDTDSGVEPPANDDALDRQIDARLEKLRIRIHRQVERRTRDHGRALALLDTLEQALQQNELQKAEQAEKQLLSILGNIPGLSEQRWRDIEARLHKARPGIRKLESWRHWGTTQAREELIEQVKQLTGSKLSPHEIAARIKQARAQWQAWDAAGDHSGKELWLAFDRTCETAYTPCLAHFEQLKAQRADNLRQRRQLVDELNARYDAVDWKHPDWRDIDKFVGQARRQFLRTGNVDFKQRKPLAKAMDSALAKFDTHLSRERTRSFRAREKLVADIEALQGMEDLRDALKQLETLKKQWQITVVETRKRENSLWKQYQAACDALYRRRDSERKGLLADLNRNLKKKQALLTELSGAAQAQDAALLDESRINRLLDEWRKIGQIPRDQESTLDRRWREAQRRYHEAVAAARQRSRAAAFVNLARRAALCDRWEQAVLAGETVDPVAAGDAWQSLPELPEAMAETITRRYERALEWPDDATLARNLATKQQACLRLEVLLELPSPEPHQAERMAYQVERLNRALQKERDALDSPESLLLEALVTGAVPADGYGLLEQRIGACLARFTSGS